MKPLFTLLFFVVIVCCAALFLQGCKDDVDDAEAPSTTNKAIAFDGVDDYIDLGNIYDDLTLPFTISA